MTTTPKFIRVGESVYKRITAEQFSRNPGIAIIDPSNFEPQDEHFSLLARAVMIALASAMVSTGVKSQADLTDYREEDLVAQIPRILQKLNSKSGLFRQEMQRLKSKGPERYVKDAGRELVQVR